MSAESLLQTPHFGVGVECKKEFGQLVRLDESYWDKTTEFLKNTSSNKWISGKSMGPICFGYRLEITDKRESGTTIFKIFTFGTTTFGHHIANGISNPEPFIMDPTKHSAEIKKIEEESNEVTPIILQITTKGSLISGCGYFNFRSESSDQRNTDFDKNSLSIGFADYMSPKPPSFPNTYLNIEKFDIGVYYIISSFFSSAYFPTYTHVNSRIDLRVLRF